MDKERTGQLITELRKEKGLTQKQLADALNVTDKAVSKWERGLSFPDVSMLEPLSELLGVSIMEILAGERQTGDGTLTREEAQDLINASVELGDEEIKHKKERSRLIIIILIVISMLLVSITLNIISLLRSRRIRKEKNGGIYDSLVYLFSHSWCDPVNRSVRKACK